MKSFLQSLKNTSLTASGDYEDVHDFFKLKRVAGGVPYWQKLGITLYFSIYPFLSLWSLSTVSYQSHGNFPTLLMMNVYHE